MRPEGNEFDPNLHAVMRQPTNEHPEGTVELVMGYFWVIASCVTRWSKLLLLRLWKHHRKILRPSSLQCKGWMIQALVRHE